MTLQEASLYIENIEPKSTKKSEIKTSEKFLHILTKLKTREFSKDEILAIETELDSLNLKSNSENSKKHLRKLLPKFEKYLKDKFSLTSKDYYTSLGIGLGSSFGVVFGIVILSRLGQSTGIALGISIGMIVGLIVGKTMDAKAMKEGRVL